MATIPVAPPPPPIIITSSGPKIQYPKSNTYRNASTLSRSERAPANSHNLGSISNPVSSKPERPMLDSATLLNAAQRLRKTEHSQQVYSPEQEQHVGRSVELPIGRHRSNNSQHERMEQYPAREPIHDANFSPYAYSTIGVNGGYPIPLNPTQQSTQQYSSNNNSYTTNQTYNSVPPPLPTNPPPSFLNSSTNPNYSSQTTYSYVDPQNYTIKESYHSPPINNNGIQTYKTYTSTTSSYVGGGSPNKQTPQFDNKSQPNKLNNNFQQFQTQQPTFPSGVINNPQSYIHEFATRTPIAILSPNQQPNNQSNSNNSYSSYSTYSTTNNNNNTFSTQKKPISYAEELRNSSLTESQKHWNQQQQSIVADRPIPNNFHNLYEEKIRSSQRTDQVDELVKDMETQMRMRTSGRDICAKCSTAILGDTPGVTALGKPYHVNCFSCDACQKQLAGCSFYSVDGKNLCQVDYMNSLEKCEKCATPITQKILRALGKPFHPECFVCPSCQKSLDGIPFTVSKENVAYCLDCYHERYSPRCAVCLKAIAPSGNEVEVARVIAMDKSYHVECYRCEDCGLKLNSKVEGAACYPLQGHLFCKDCNLTRLKATT